MAEILFGPDLHCEDAVHSAWQQSVAAKLSDRTGSSGMCICGFNWHLVASTLVRDRQMMLLRAILAGSIWNGF